MPKYRVEYSAYAYVIVRAESEEEAEELADDLIDDETAHWDVDKIEEESE